MKLLNPEWIEWFKPFVNSSPYFSFLGMKLNNLTYGESFLELEVKKNHLQAHGVAHGGVLASLLDATGTLAAVTQIEGLQSATTVELKINFLSSVNKGKLLAHGRCIKLGRTIGVSEVSITNENQKPISHGLVTLMVTPPLEFPGIESIPFKFL